MTPRPPEVADVFRRYGDSYREQHGASLSTEQRRAMSAIEICRTAALGGHVEQCDSCSHQRISYNSCRSRSCPKCQSLARAQWVEDRQAELLDTEYFHVVFTVPDEIAVIAYQNKAQVYDILFHAAAEPSVPMTMRQTPPWSLPLRAEVTSSHGHAAHPLRKDSCRWLRNTGRP